MLRSRYQLGTAYVNQGNVDRLAYAQVRSAEQELELRRAASTWADADPLQSSARDCALAPLATAVLGAVFCHEVLVVYTDKPDAPPCVRDLAMTFAYLDNTQVRDLFTTVNQLIDLDLLKDPPDPVSRLFESVMLTTSSSKRLYEGLDLGMDA